MGALLSAIAETGLAVSSLFRYYSTIDQQQPWRSVTYLRLRWILFPVASMMIVNRNKGLNLA